MGRMLMLAAIAGGLFWAYSTVSPSTRARLGVPASSGSVLTGAPARGVASGIGNLAGKVLP
jgi:hypothetical protein